MFKYPLYDLCAMLVLNILYDVINIYVRSQIRFQTLPI